MENHLMQKQMNTPSASLGMMLDIIKSHDICRHLQYFFYNMNIEQLLRHLQAFLLKTKCMLSCHGVGGNCAAT